MLLTPIDLFARAYTQYVAWRSGDDDLLDGIDRVLASADSEQQWPYTDFLPLIHKFDTLFERRGWLTRNRL